MNQDESKHQITSFGYNLFAGGLAGCVAKTVIAPFDRAKINFQSTERRFSVRALFRFLHVSYQQSGFFSLWRGNTATLTRIFPYAAIQYSSHERYKHAFGIDQPDLSHIEDPDLRFVHIVDSVQMAGITSVASTYPLDFGAPLFITFPFLRYSNLIDALRTVCREEGIRTLYRGVQPAVLGSIPYAGTAFLTFETLKEYRMTSTVSERPGLRSGRILFLLAEYYARYGENKHAQENGIRPEKLQPLENLVCGGFSGILGQTASYPLDIVRRRMQTAGVTGHPEYCLSIAKTLRIVYNSEGLFRGLYKGVTLNWIKGPIASSISFTVFHQVQHLLHWYDRSRVHRPT
ncbi:Mitochondrial carrier protein [Fasciola gigantica]|uniref:Mitochondrial carrier protein n=1 Tax=Fasciola gigantica TaxID=46835 RepID=A0A504ZEX0_FASGI|nr:Mitochondrial carrier protein [Fasciola gigantica]